MKYHPAHLRTKAHLVRTRVATLRGLAGENQKVGRATRRASLREGSAHKAESLARHIPLVPEGGTT